LSILHKNHENLNPKLPKLTKGSKIMSNTLSRTDLAIEVIPQIPTINSKKKPLRGIEYKERGKSTKITEIVISDDEIGRPIGKQKGRYITFELGDFSRFDVDYADLATELSVEIRSLLPKKLTSKTLKTEQDLVLVAGLGNNDITPDSLGVKASRKVLATRHLKEEYDPFLADFRPVSVISSGVLAQTGIETAELVGAISAQLRPSAVIIVDALACSSISRLGTTIQLSDTGISPGSGVQNSRKPLNFETLGVPVISIGVPTVVDIFTIFEEIAEDFGINDWQKTKNFDLYKKNMMVTPRDIDKLISKSADLIATALNLALHNDITFEEIQALTA
jgi:spore protease